MTFCKTWQTEECIAAPSLGPPGPESLHAEQSPMDMQSPSQYRIVAGAWS